MGHDGREGLRVGPVEVVSSRDEDAGEFPFGVGAQRRGGANLGITSSSLALTSVMGVVIRRREIDCRPRLKSITACSRACASNDSSAIFFGGHARVARRW